MKKFRFPLDRLRAFRQLKLDEATARLQTLLDEGYRLELRRQELSAEELRVHQSLRRLGHLGVEELSAVEGFRRWAEVEAARLASAATELSKRVDQQRAVLLEARREVESLDHLKSKRLEQWRHDLDRETEATVAELVVSRWKSTN